MRVFIKGIPFGDEFKKKEFDRGNWPARWINIPISPETPCVAAYRLKFEMKADAVLRVHVSADQRYDLFLDGRRIGRGPERGDKFNWFYETYELNLSKGSHVLVGRSWWFTQHNMLAPSAQISVSPGFMLAADAPFTELLSTGVADWQGKQLGGYSVRRNASQAGDCLVGGTLLIDGATFDNDFKTGGGLGWDKPQIGSPAQERFSGWGGLSRRIAPATLPDMLDKPIAGCTVRHIDSPPDDKTEGFAVQASRCIAGEKAAWQKLFDCGGSVEIPANTIRRVVVDLGNYYCLYPRLEISGGVGGCVRVWLTEALNVNPKMDHRKTNRDQTEGLHLLGRGDTYLPGGKVGEKFEGLWWYCGKFMEIFIRTADQPLRIDKVELAETRYPLEMQAKFDCDEPRFGRAVPIMWRTIQMCAHETYMDCPFFEQLMYAGDTRLQMLVTYVCNSDDRLPRKALRMLEASRLPNGLTHSCYPNRGGQLIPQFSLFWATMVCDYALWRGDREFVRAMMPGVRGVLETFINHIGPEGLLVTPDGWNWVDWVPKWRDDSMGGPPLDSSRFSGINNWQLVMTLRMVEQLENWLGETVLAGRLGQIAKSLADKATKIFWDEKRGLMADTPSRDNFSEHCQCYSVLGGLDDPAKLKSIAKGLVESKNLDEATVYFMHYLFETYRRLDIVDAMFGRMPYWYELPDKGFSTVLECPEPSRSDCHAWGAHPIYHALATVLGIRPAEYGFGSVEIKPKLGPLKNARGTMVHPAGPVTVECSKSGGKLEVMTDLPKGLGGRIIVGKNSRAVKSGKQKESFEI